MGTTLSWGLGSWRNEVQGPVPAPGECTFIHSASPSCIHSLGHSFTHTQGPTYEPQDYLQAILTITSVPPFSCCPILGHSAHPSQPHDPTLPASSLTAEGEWGGGQENPQKAVPILKSQCAPTFLMGHKRMLCPHLLISHPQGTLRAW